MPGFRLRSSHNCRLAVTQLDFVRHTSDLETNINTILLDMNAFKECLAEDYSKAVAKSLDTILGKIKKEGSLSTSAVWERFPRIAEVPEHQQIVNTFRPVR